MKSNIVMLELNPETLTPYRVYESLLTTAALEHIGKIVFNSDDATDEDWAQFNVLNDAADEEKMDETLIQKLEFPFETKPGEKVFHVVFVL